MSDQQAKAPITEEEAQALETSMMVEIDDPVGVQAATQEVTEYAEVEAGEGQANTDQVTEENVTEIADATCEKEHEKDGVAASEMAGQSKVLENEQGAENTENPPILENSENADTPPPTPAEEAAVQTVQVGFEKTLAEIEAELGAKATKREVEVFRKFYLAACRDAFVFANIAVNQIITAASALQPGLQAAVNVIHEGQTWLLTDPSNTGVSAILGEEASLTK